MRRGDIVIAVVAGDYGKPGPAVVMQTDAIPASHPSVVICPITSSVGPESAFRFTIEPYADSGLRLTSQIMVDKVLTVRRDRIRSEIGHLSDGDLERLDTALAFVLGLAD